MAAASAGSLRSGRRGHWCGGAVVHASVRASINWWISDLINDLICELVCEVVPAI
ncbi:hypothetical protein [Catenulispora yoronensis]|uniref:hypothetical protein n=1 Tax=Catenulispora yoronensis TaxID=450799 RepID=UPI0031E29CA8